MQLVATHVFNGARGINRGGGIKGRTAVKDKGGLRGACELMSEPGGIYGCREHGCRHQLSGHYKTRVAHSHGNYQHQRTWIIGEYGENQMLYFRHAVPACGNTELPVRVVGGMVVAEPPGRHLCCTSTGFYRTQQSSYVQTQDSQTGKLLKDGSAWIQLFCPIYCTFNKNLTTLLPKRGIEETEKIQ